MMRGDSLDPRRCHNPQTRCSLGCQLPPHSSVAVCTCLVGCIPSTSAGPLKVWPAAFLQMEQ
jgi:hypothetical protein